MTDLGLKDYHEASIISFMRFSRSQRGLSLKTIHATYKDIEHQRLKNETTLTVDEVHDLLLELWEMAKDVIDNELSHQAHTYVLLLRQLFMQAEHWHLKLQADISELENRELLDRIRNFEMEQFRSKSKKEAPRLEPVNENSGTALLRNRIAELEDECDFLKRKVKEYEKKLIEMSDGHGSARSSEYSSKKSSKYSDDDVAQLENKMSQLMSEMHKSKEYSASNAKNLENEMISIKHRYLEIQEQLHMAERELEKKFNQTNAYKNMKQMLDKKNEQIKDLRRRLNRYEPPDD